MACLNPGSDDRKIDRNHRQNAGREVQREAANQDEQFLDRTLADNTFSAHFNFGDQVSIWFLVSPS